MMRRDVGVILVAAGKSVRIGGTTPKVWLPFRGAPLLARSLLTLLELDELSECALVVRDEDRVRAGDLVDTVTPRLAARVRIVAGGALRRDSVRAGLLALSDPAIAIVLVHDAARPNASVRLFKSVVAAAREHGAAVPALPVVDTLRRRDDRGVAHSIDRSGVHAIQTPQGFQRDLLRRAHAEAVDVAAVTDDAMLVEALGTAVVWVAGEPANAKVTLPEDLETIARLAGGDRVATRIGLGHDLHRLEAGGTLRLGGIDVGGDVHAVGHSDGDVLLHAVTDAILGACALGDIGQHFSDQAAENRGRDSAEFLCHALLLARTRGFSPLQVDVVVRLERPKLAPFRAAMVARLAELLQLTAESVSIKAKTAESQDAIGAGRAVACEAVVQMVARES